MIEPIIHFIDSYSTLFFIFGVLAWFFSFRRYKDVKYLEKNLLEGSNLVVLMANQIRYQYIAKYCAVVEKGTLRLLYGAENTKPEEKWLSKVLDNEIRKKVKESEKNGLH